SAINTLTLRKAAGAGGPVSLNGGVACMGSDYVTIQGFDSLGGVSFGNGANYGSVLDTVVNGTVQFSGASTNGLIQNVVINPGVGGYGVFANGSGNHNLTVRAATINITGGVGIYLNAGQNNVTIERSEIIGSGANYGIYFYGATAASTGLVIRNNVIRGGFNNSGIILLAGMSSITGVGYHNTIRMDVEGSKGIILNRDVPFLTTFDFRNNIVSHTGTTTNSLAISFNTPTGNFTSNYNILHLPNGAAIGNWGANSATLPGWQLDTGKDAQSFSVDPLFLSATDSRIGDNSFAQNRGLNSLGVATDLIGAARDAATPDPGAYENAVAPTYPAPLGAASYSVKGDGSGDYTSVSKAVSDLQARGQSGPVVLEVYAGTYSQGIGLGSVSGNSATNTITIRKAAAAGGAVNVGPIFISGTDYVTVEGFDAITGPVIFANGATYGNLLSTSVNGGVQFTGGSTNGLVQDVSVTVSGGGVYGISLPSSGNHGFTARRVTVNASAAARGVYVTGQNNDLTIEGSQLIGNGAEYGLYFNSTASASTGLLVRNSIVRGTFTIGGVYFLGAAGAGITGAYNHNTVSVSTNGTYGVRFERVGGLTLEFKNNIVSHAGTTAASYALYNINANLTSNNNVYYVPSGASLAYTGGAMRSTLADWQLATGWDAQSLATNPLFVSATDLHIGDNSYAQNRGASGLGIATDLSGAARDASTPDPGAYENAVVPSFPPAMSGTYLVKPDGTGDYTTLWSALLDLEARGMSGAVVFEAYAGTYSKPLGLSAVAGNSAVNTITIGKSLSAGGAVNISSTVTVNGTDYVVFTGFDSISGTIQFGGGAVGGIVQDSTINVTGASASGILLSGTGNNGFVARGVVITAASSASGITISGQSDNVTIEESELIGSSGGNGIVFTAATAASSGLLIRNNFIRGTFVTAGINLNSASAAIAAAAYHNAIRISTNGSRGVLLTRASPLTIDFSNNIVAQYGTTTASYAIYDTGAALTSNNNILYAPSGGYIGYSGGANRPTFANWQALGFDASSINADPLFVSGTDLHIQAGSPAQGTGVAGLGVATDIDGQARANPPDIGADEN
ncbi:MAG: right-handed parallel beta-helix repeat-containing protein, partial [Oligoflexia bacterium]|nr:right-handed parallel beta-helix repeat-containing protein [Oligoflexia bacterium]